MADMYDFYKKLLPEVHKLNDPDEAIKAIIDGFQEEILGLRTSALALPTLLDLDQAPCNILPYLANHVGLEVESCDPCDLIREQIRAAVPIYRVKGTKQSFEALMRSLGFQATVISLFEDGPDSANTLDEADAITGFNTRVPGFNMSSRIRMELVRLPEAENLDLCGADQGLISSFLLSRILKRLRDVTPIHIDLNIFIIFTVNDTLTMADDILFSMRQDEVLNMGCCCYHGKGAFIENEVFVNRYDSGLLYDNTPNINLYDAGTSGSLCPTYDNYLAFYDDDASFELEQPNLRYDRFCPRLGGVFCGRGEENAFSLHRHGHVVEDGLDLVISSTVATVTSVSSLFVDLGKVQENYFVRVNHVYRQIINVVSNTELEIVAPFDTDGTFSFEIVLVDSFLQRQALHKDPNDQTIPKYFHRIEPTPLVQWDVGFLWDDNHIWDSVGLKHDCCEFEVVESEENSVITRLAPIAEIIPGSEGMLVLPPL